LVARQGAALTVVELNADEINLLLSCISLALNLMTASDMVYQRDQLLALQKKLITVRGGE
jgi:hypothetical protein